MENLHILNDCTNEMLAALSADPNFKSRHFVIDYTDKDGGDLNTEVLASGAMNDANIIKNLAADFKSKGFKLMQITELLNGHSKEILEKMCDENPREAVKHFKILYAIQ